MGKSSALTTDVIRDLAGTKAWQRGVDYFEDGRVVSVEHRNDWVHGKVAGSYRYRCKLRMSDEGLVFTCTCPVGDDRALCKHVVATALAYLNDSEDRPASSGVFHNIYQSVSRAVSRRFRVSAISDSNCS